MLTGICEVNVKPTFRRRHVRQQSASDECVRRFFGVSVEEGVLGVEAISCSFWGVSKASQKAATRGKLRVIKIRLEPQAEILFFSIRRRIQNKSQSSQSRWLAMAVGG